MKHTRCSFLIMTTRTDCKCCMLLLQPHRQEGGYMDPFLREKEGGGGPANKTESTCWWVCGCLTIQYLWHAASPDSHTLPSALGWKRMFGSRGRPQSPAHGGKEALTECEAVPLCRPHRTSHLGWGVREYSPHHYHDNRWSNSKARGQKGVNPSGQSEQQRSSSVSQRCRVTLQHWCAGGGGQPTSSYIHSSLIWGHSSALAVIKLNERNPVVKSSWSSEPTSHIRN